MSDIKISVIMPVYNVEAYVAKAIESMLAQTLTDFEFLIVDDGTKDKSGIICDEYAKKDSRIHVIHKENGGAPSARNTAIDIAKGKYMYFMDSDDWAEPTMLEDMYALAEKNAAQLVVCGFYIDTYYGTQHLSEKICVDNKKKMLINQLKEIDSSAKIKISSKSILSINFNGTGGMIFRVFKLLDIIFAVVSIVAWRISP